ncbi:MAG TPA: acyl-ACP--UDP-N-acetylglucosamine O-acyltransferase [Opitutaceae bacterium]|nr:acyl-ACP--UDP-N-acetylglucosamine O-acyltransferase [Opitutaceae bacterium]
MSQIHPTAIIEEGVELGRDCVLHAHAIVRRGTVLGERVTVHPFAVIGGDPQDLRFDPATASGVRIGSGTTIREHVTVNRSTKAGAATVVGERCFLMAACHVAHDCVVGNDVVIANAVLLAGHVQVGDRCFLGGSAMFHQFARVGEGAIISGGSRVALDVPPFAMAAERNEVIGLNLVGLKRRGVARETIREIKDAFRAVYFTPGNIRSVAAGALGTGAFRSDEARRFLEFFATGKRGFARARRTTDAEGETATG